jgi:hypothetical protein
MKKVNFQKLFIVGLAAGIAISPCTISAADMTTSKPTETAPAGKSITTNELLDSLSPETKQLYNSLTPEGKQLATNYALQTCSGSNGCGYGTGVFKDKNEAVKAAAKKIADKRTNSGY